MRLTCPHCGFSKEVPDDRLPQVPTRVSCPQCKESFALPLPSAPAVAPADFPAPEVVEVAAQKTAPAPPLADRPKAGFWMRYIAQLIDGFLLSLIYAAFMVTLLLLGGTDLLQKTAMSGLSMAFFLVLGLFYWVFFTGYCGQTPGKMLLRIQVVRLDGKELGYGQAFYREVIGKFLSGLIFFIGYLMAAFDDRKQALHDRMAKTYVVKL